MVEYHIPKLARTEIAGAKENPVAVEYDVVDVAKRIAFLFSLAEDQLAEHELIQLPG